MRISQTSHAVRMEDLNHHQSLYGGRAIDWFMEATFICGAKENGSGEGMVYKNTHSFNLFRQIRVGEIITYQTTLVRVGGSSFTLRCGIVNELSGEALGEGYITYVTIDEASGKAVPCTMELDETEDGEELAWRAKADSFFSNRRV